MGFISGLLKKLFGDNHNQPEISLPLNHNFMAQWEKEQEERIVAAEARIKDWLITSLKEKGNLPFSWESGGDEAFVTFQDNDGTDEENFEDLEEYIIDKLNIPDAGEFQMNGSGTIYIENNLARAKYSSTIKAVIDYDEETEEEIFSEEEQDSGDKVLFAV
jgi:hypothetical protein